MELNPRGHRLILSASNPVIKRAKSLRDKKYRRSEALFLAEGLRILTEARDAGVLPQQLFYADNLPVHALGMSLITATIAAGGEVVATSSAILSRLSGKDNPQTMIGLYKDRMVPLHQVDRSRAPIWMVVQAMRDPGNLGTIMRTGDAVGAGGIILIDDCVDPFSVETIRASMGAIFTQTVSAARWPDFIAWLRGGPGTLVGTSLADDSVDYRQPNYPAPTFILTGNEAQGLPEDYAGECDFRVKIPMLGKADSLNAAVATAVMAYHVLDKQGGA
ncbi:MAG: RNA methyltransferase [Sphingopyxis sp.]